MKRSLAERFAEKTTPEPNTGCLLWTGFIHPMGYGRIRVGNKIEGAHRVAFLLVHGRWPNPSALHKCDTPACVEAAHLFEGTQTDNMADRDAKGRSRKVRGKYAPLNP